MKNLIKLSAILLIFTSMAWSCKKDDNSNNGTAKGIVLEKGTTTGIAGAKITVYDAATNAPTSYTLTTGTDGSYSILLPPGTYYLRIEKQGYIPIPTNNTTPITFTVTAGGTSSNNFELTKSTVTNAGFISGTVKSASAGIAGALVVASNTTNGYSGISDANGNYVIYNVPAGSYSVSAYKASYNGNAVSASVVVNAETKSINIDLTSNATANVTGQVAFLATNNKEVDVTLVNPFTREAVPGLAVKTVNYIYDIKNVPIGKYIMRATYNNDSLVVDPDWIVKFGEPVINVTAATGTFTQNVSVTGAVALTSPTNPITSVTPVEVSASGLTLVWKPYPSTNDYVVEISDMSGNVIWGGFNKSGSPILKNITFPSSITSCVVPSTVNLKVGQIYRWKVYASKNDVKSLPEGWKLISSSEDQQGLIKIK